jgi:hypothetical protein
LKKLLVLVLVLGLVSVANAGLTFKIVDSLNATVTEMTVGSTYTAVVSGTSIATHTGGLYGPAYAASDWALVTPSSPIDLDASGDLGTILWIDGYQGYDFTSADASSSVLPDQAIGEWFKVTLTPTATGDFTLGLFWYEGTGGTGTAEATINATIIPEPITMTLLGLGGLFLRRRSK